MGTTLVESLPSIVTSFVAIVGIRIAWLGLTTWKAQAKWTNDSALAKEILVQLINHIDAMKNVRFFLISPDEIEEATKGKEIPKDDRFRRFHEHVSVYEARWKKVRDVRSQLYPLIIEGQALWGVSFKDKFADLWKLENELFSVVRLHLEQMNPSYDAETQREFYNIRKEKRDIIYLGDEATDVHVADYMKALSPIENYLRGKLGRTT